MFFWWRENNPIHTSYLTLHAEDGDGSLHLGVNLKFGLQIRNEIAITFSQIYGKRLLSFKARYDWVLCKSGACGYAGGSMAVDLGLTDTHRDNSPTYFFASVDETDLWHGGRSNMWDASTCFLPGHVVLIKLLFRCFVGCLWFVIISLQLSAITGVLIGDYPLGYVFHSNILYRYLSILWDIVVYPNLVIRMIPDFYFRFYGISFSFLGDLVTSFMRCCLPLYGFALPSVGFMYLLWVTFRLI